jgi:hypothetical protein
LKRYNGIIEHVGLDLFQVAFVCAAVSLLSGCTSPIPVPQQLEQSQPRKVSKSLKLPTNTQTGFVIAGLKQGAVPQGLTLLSDGWALTSHYFDNGLPSCIVTTDRNTGKAIKTLHIMEPDGSQHNGHVGGIAADENSLWIASDAFLYRGNLLAITTNSADGVFRTMAKFETEAAHEAAFCSVFDGFVWAGEFALEDKYPTPPSHQLVARDGTSRTGWICGYDPIKGFKHPERALSIPDRTQGILAADNYIFLSRSYGRRNRSSIEIFNNPFSEAPHKTVQSLDGSDVPLWFLDGKNHVRSIDLPPMSENIAADDGKLLILFESGASKFKWFGKKPIDQLILLKLEELKR